MPMHLSFAHVKSAARAAGIALVTVGASQLSEVPRLLAVGRKACEIQPPIPCWLLPQVTWSAVVAISLILLAGGLITTRRQWVGFSLLAISLIWFLHFCAPHFPLRFIWVPGFQVGGRYLNALGRFFVEGTPVLTAGILLLMADRIWRNHPKLQHVLLKLRDVFVKWIPPKWILRAVGATVVAEAAHRFREVPWRMAAARDERLWQFPRTMEDALRDATWEATFSISLVVLGVGLLVARRSALGVALLVVSGLVVFHVLMPTFPDEPLGSANIVSNLLSRPLFNGVHIVISVLLSLTAIRLLRGKASVWFASGDVGIHGT